MRFTIKNTDFVIKFTENSFDLYEVRVVADKDSVNYGSETEDLVGYFSELRWLYKKLVKVGLSKANVATFDEVLSVVKQVEHALDGLLLPKEGKQCKT